MNQINHELRHDVIVGRCDHGSVKYPKHAGMAFCKEGEGHYCLRLHMFPGITYCLSKNHGENPNYTLFSTIVNGDGGIRFQNLVGAARLTQDLKTHLEIRLNHVERRLYMNLFTCQ